MTPLELARFRKAVVEAWPNTPFHESEAELWFDAVIERDATAVFDALRTLISTCDFRPRLAALLELLYDGPTARDVAAECRNAIRRFGYHREDEALASLSEPAQKAIDAFGGWVEWCSAPDDVDTVESMARICGNLVRKDARRLQLPAASKRLELEGNTHG